MPDFDYSPEVQTDGLPGRDFPRLPDELPNAVPQLGRAIQDVGSVVAQHTQAAEQQALRTQYADADNKIQALSLSLTSDPQTGAFTKQGQNAFGLPQQYLPKFDAGAQQIIASIPDPRVQQQVANAAMQRRLQLTSQLDSHEMQQHKEFSSQTANASISLAQQDSASNYNHPDILASNMAKVDGALAMRSDQEGWSPQMFQEAQHAAHVQLHTGVLTAMLKDGQTQMAQHYLDAYRSDLTPTEAASATDAINAGVVKTNVDSVMSAYRTDTTLGEQRVTALANSGLSADDQLQVTQEVDRQRTLLAAQRRQDPAVQRQLQTLDASLASGQVVPGSESQIDNLWRRGALTDDQHLSMRDQLIRAQQSGNNDAQNLAYARANFANRTPMDQKDATDKKAVDLLFQATSKGQAPGSPGYNNAATAIVGRVGVVPEGALSFARASLIAGDPKSAAGGAQLLASIQTANPRAYVDATDENTRAMADTINRAVKAGTDPVAAVQLARGNAQQTEGSHELLDDAWKAQKPNQTIRWGTVYSNAIRNGLSSDPDYKAPGLHFGNTVPAVPTSMAAEFGDLSKDYFTHTNGNLQQAQQLALNDLKATWGVSTVNGTRELMKYAPEHMVPGLTPDMIHADLAASGHADAHLTESPETGSSGGKVWNLTTKDQFGAYDVVRDTKGLPVRYQLPDVTKARAEAQAAQEKADRQRLLLEQQTQQEEAEARQARDAGMPE